MAPAGDVHAPPPPPTPDVIPEVPKEFVGRTGYGELTGELRSMMSGDLEHVEGFPEGITDMEKKQWYNHSLRTDSPLTIASHDENRRIWQEMEVEKMLDHHPPHEMHPKFRSHHYHHLHHLEVKTKKVPLSPTRPVPSTWMGAKVVTSCEMTTGHETEHIHPPKPFSTIKSLFFLSHPFEIHSKKYTQFDVARFTPTPPHPPTQTTPTTTITNNLIAICQIIIIGR